MRSGPEARTSVCRVERGLYLLRYVEAAGLPNPDARMTVLSGDMRFVSAPGREADYLGAPGHTLVIVAEGPSEFEIQVTGTRDGITDAKFSIDMLDPGEIDADRRRHQVDHHRSSERHSQRSVAEQQAQGHDRRLAVAAHVSRRGDVLVGDDEWVAGPDVVLPIEGLSIDTGRADVGVLIRVQSSRSGQRWSRWHDPEEFAGSRQQADSLTAIALALTGSAADRFEIVAEVMALGMPSAAKQGQMVEFFGVDPIVGFRFALQPAIRRTVENGSPAGTPLRVFRARR